MERHIALNETLCRRMRKIRELETKVGTSARAEFLSQYLAAAEALQKQIALCDSYINFLKDASNERLAA